jgi:hypothetical protein
MIARMTAFNRFSEPLVPHTSRNWQAWRFHNPDGESVLLVTGLCIVETDGYTAFLRRVEPQGYNPDILLLEKVITPPFGPDLPSPFPHTIEIRFEDRVHVHYTHVQIVSDYVTLAVRDVL